ncbi:MAG: phospholipid/cholesterol/gamma-HCH transport system substrate-binding protein [Mycobacterium sp.]|jgi:phospholipid/cholesterol/gamma-HCH transport system substrate-binding protein|nr:phospholipid/cholesterol/gamma-HCH transport system substrate-binding protein [Mycobacterium sp.]
MMGARSTRRLLVIACSVAVTATGCAFQGVNSLPLPGAVGRGTGAIIYHVEIANVGTLESNSPVMIDDVVIGSVGKMTVQGWHADVEISVKPDVVIPANAVASVGQTSLLGSMHLAVNPPLGQPPTGRLQPGATIPLNRSSTYPSTEQTLSSLSAVVNGGGLGQIGDIIHNFNAALSGREDQVRDLITRLDTFVGMLDRQHDNIIASVEALNRLAATFAEQRDVITQALRKIPPALDVLNKERPRITTALDKLRTLSDTASGLVNDTQADLVKNLQNLEPTIKALADIGPDLDAAIAQATVYPYAQSFIDRAVRGDYVNFYAILDLTVPRLKRTLFLGTRWGQEGAELAPAPGDPWYLNYSYNPLGVGVNPPPADAAPPLDATALAVPAEAASMPPVTEPLLPVVPPMSAQAPPPPGSSPLQIFAGG